MRKLVLILIAFIAAASFIRSFDKGAASLAASDMSSTMTASSLAAPFEE
jgi:hypothetical protein